MTLVWMSPKSWQKFFYSPQKQSFSWCKISRHGGSITPSPLGLSQTQHYTSKEEFSIGHTKCFPYGNVKELDKQKRWRNQGREINRNTHWSHTRSICLADIKWSKIHSQHKRNILLLMNGCKLSVDLSCAESAMNYSHLCKLSNPDRRNSTTRQTWPRLQQNLLNYKLPILPTPTASVLVCHPKHANEKRSDQFQVSDLTCNSIIHNYSFSNKFMSRIIVLNVLGLT